MTITPVPEKNATREAPQSLSATTDPVAAPASFEKTLDVPSAPAGSVAGFEPTEKTQHSLSELAGPTAKQDAAEGLQAALTTPPPIRVLFFYQDFGAMGGIERYLLQTASLLRQRGNFEPVFACCENGPLSGSLKAAGFQVYELPHRKCFARSILRMLDVPTFWRMVQILKTEKPALVHVHIGVVENTLFRWLGYPVVYTVHGYSTLYSLQAVTNPLKKVLKQMVRWLFQKNADAMNALLFVSGAEQNRMLHEGFINRKHPAEVIHNGLPIADLQHRATALRQTNQIQEAHQTLQQTQQGQEIYQTPQKTQQAPKTQQPQLRERLGIPPQARVVSFINRMDSNKNPLHFVTLAQQLLEEEGLNTVHAGMTADNMAQTLPSRQSVLDRLQAETADEIAQSLPSKQSALNDLHFVMAGDGPLLDTVRAATADIPQIHVLGYCPDVIELLAVTDVLVYPARREGFGLGLVEAMAVGVPCVAYASGGAMEILDVGATAQCLTPIDDENALLANVREMLQLPEPERQTLQNALRQRAMAFDSERFIEKLEAVYLRLVPKVSVILPVYQGEASILQAVRSVLKQTYANLELIVVDDGSTDNTLVKLATVRDPRLKIVRQENAGVATARNHGFSQATGEFIAFIDADDVWLPEKLAVEIALIRNMSAEQRTSDRAKSVKQPDKQRECLVYSGYYAVDDKNRLTHLPAIRRESGDLAQNALAEEGIFLPSTTLVHRAVFEAVGGFKADCYHEDRVFFIEACRQFPAHTTGERLVVYRQSLSGRCRSILKDYNKALTAELSIVETLRPVLSESEQAHLHHLQLRNLMFRFLMYGEIRHAQTIAAQLRQAGSPENPKNAELNPATRKQAATNNTGSTPPDAQAGSETLRQTTEPLKLFSGKKGMLALLSLKTGVNFLSLTRMLVQSATRTSLAPWWKLKTEFMHDSSRNHHEYPMNGA